MKLDPTSDITEGDRIKENIVSSKKQESEAEPNPGNMASIMAISVVSTFSEECVSPG